LKNVNKWSIGHLKFDPPLSFSCPEGFEVFINGNQAFIDIIGRAELAWHGNEIVDKNEMKWKCPRLLLI
jgi:hypothetical protein